MWGRIRARARTSFVLVGVAALVGAGVAAQSVEVIGIGGATAAGAAANTVVSIQFDDGYASQYQTRAMLSAHGMHATYYINSGTRPPEFGNMSWAQLHDLANDGNEIGGHTIDHADLPTLSTSAATAEVCNDRTARE